MKSDSIQLRSCEIFDAWQGDKPLGVHSHPFAVRSFREVIDRLGLQRSHWKCPASDPPPAVDAGFQSDSDDIGSPTAVLIKASDRDVAELRGWKSGWYLLRLGTEEARTRLGIQKQNSISASRLPEYLDHPLTQRIWSVLGESNHAG